MKCCSKCEVVKAKSEFARNAQSKDGLRPDCRLCVKARAAAQIPNVIPKICRRCDLLKPAHEYRPTGRVCNRCRAADAAIYHKDPIVALRAKEAAKLRWVNQKDHMSATNRKWREKNSDHMKQKVYAWRLENADAYHAINAKSRKKNIARVMVSNGERRAVERRATPAWADKKAMQSFYERARLITEQSGERHDVDHIVPLKSKFVCGLHCEANLNVITAKQNVTKKNIYWPDMPEKA